MDQELRNLISQENRLNQLGMQGPEESQFPLTKGPRMKPASEIQPIFIPWYMIIWEIIKFVGSIVLLFVFVMLLILALPFLIGISIYQYFNPSDDDGDMDYNKYWIYRQFID